MKEQGELGTGLKEITEELDGQCSKILAIHKTIEHMKTTFATQQTVATVKARLDSFAQIEHIDQLKNVLLPRVAQFSTLLETYTDENMQVKAIV